MTPSRKIAEQSNTEHRSKTTTNHRTGNAQRPRPARRGGGEHQKPAQKRDLRSEVAAPTAAASTRAVAAESAPAGNDRLAEVSAVLLMVLSGVAMVLFFVALAIGPSI